MDYKLLLLRLDKMPEELCTGTYRVSIGTAHKEAAEAIRILEAENAALKEQVTQLQTIITAEAKDSGEVIIERDALKEQVAQLELVKDEHDERGIDIDILVRNLNSAEAQLTALQSKSAALVDAMNKVSMLLCEANPNCSQEYLFGVITGTHTVSEAALAAFKGE